jgi:lipopolysaccharide biosynthesis glycosyltransferase
MKTLVVSFGDGRYLQPAQASVKRFSRLNDVEGMVLDINKLPERMEHPAWAKAWIWDQVPKDVERVIWIDADVVPVRPIMDILPDFPVPFAAVQDAKQSRQTAEWGNEKVEDLDVYFNSGVFVAHRDSEPMFREWREGSSVKSKQPFVDQTPLNLMLAKHLKPGEISELPKICNWIGGFGSFPQTVRMVHFAGLQKALRLDILRVFALTEEEDATNERYRAKGVVTVQNWGVS